MNVGHRHAVSALIGLATWAIVVLIWQAGWLQRFENSATDARARVLRHVDSSDVVIVGIDAASLAELNRWPWPRHYHAELLRVLERAAPRAVFLDIDFSAPSNAADDDALADALAAHGPVRIVLPEFSETASGAGGEVQLTRPLQSLARHAVLGSVNLEPDTDGLVRRVALSDPGARLPMAAAAQLATPFAQARPGTGVALDYAISPESFGYVSYVDVLKGRIADSVFAGKTVLVGATAAELHDLVPVPVYRSLPGVVLQGLALQSLREGPLYPIPAAEFLAALGIWTLLLTVLFGMQSWRRNVLVLLAAALLLAPAHALAYSHYRTLLEIVPFAAALVLALGVATLRSLDEQTLRALAYSLGLRRRDALLKSIVEFSSDCILAIDGAGRIQMANPAAEQLFEVGRARLQGLSLQRFLPALAAADGCDGPLRIEANLNTVQEWQARTQGGRCFPVELSFSEAGINGERLYTAIVRDISERKAQQRELEHRATHDALTGLANRAALDAHLETSVGAATPERPVALFMLDLCRFKEINDTLGHSVGDQVLQEVARRFADVVRAEGLVARVGGDEFVVAISDCRDDGRIGRLATALTSGLAAAIDLGGVSMDVGVSIGVAVAPADAEDAQTLLRRADVAMYLAKRRGSPYERYDAAHDGHSVRKLTMVSELRSAIARGGLQLHYQPQVDLRRGTVPGVEALLRWEHPLLGPVSPAEFVPVAESTDLIRPLTEFAFGEALAQIARWNRQGLNLRVAVNLSARVLHDTSLPQRLAAQLAASHVAPGSVEVEITESAVMLDPARALRIVREIHELGVLIAIDDYGVGYSALGYLRDLPVHVLKLDQSFVAGMRVREHDRVIVASTLRMAHALKLQVVGEGVETEADARLLAQTGCDLGQGYFYSKALPAPLCAPWVAARNAAAKVQETDPGQVFRARASRR